MDRRPNPRDEWRLIRGLMWALTFEAVIVALIWLILHGVI